MEILGIILIFAGCLFLCLGCVKVNKLHRTEEEQIAEDNAQLEFLRDYNNKNRQQDSQTT